MEGRANILRAMKICRFCLSDDVVLTNIYERSNKHSVPLPLQIMACVAIEVFANDGMPQLICNACRNLTIQAYTFKTNAKKADDALKLFLATGQLSKPHLKAVLIPEEQEVPSPEKNYGKILKHASAQKQKKMSKLERNEVITLNFDHNSGEQIVDGVEESQDPECVLGMDLDDENAQQFPDRQMKSEKSGPVRTDIFPCPHCERSFPLQQLLDLHVVNHDRERHFQCELCDRRFFTKYDLNKHCHTHLGDKPFECVVCQKSFGRESLLRRHEKIHIDVPKYICTDCDKTFLTKPSLDAHMEKHKKMRPYTCQICNKSFVFKQGLERHEQVHSENKPYKCNYCESSFNTAIRLTRHITTHAGLRPYPCKLCGRTFLLSHHLTRHMRSHYAIMSHGSDKSIGEYKCDICSMSFKRKDFLINHSAIHSMVNLKCVICNTSFDTAREVKEHINTHLSDLPFPCEKCDYSFNTQEQLEEHELKHAEMEYEVQIEQEVIAEAKQADETINGGSDDEDDIEIDEFTLTNDINNPEVVRREKQRPNYVEFLKDELVSEPEDDEDNAHQEEVEGMEETVDVEQIKPIVRSEGTKMYSRKSNVQRKVPAINTEQIKVASLDQINQPDLLSSFNITADTISSLPNKKYASMKIGDKVVRVQKYIVTKDEMKAMAKKGILEMKGGTVVLKNPGQPILNATLKSIEPGDLEAMIDKNLRPKQKTYQRKVSHEDASETYVESEVAHYVESSSTI